MKPKLQIVLPVLNEEISFKKNVLRLYKIISNSLTEYEWTITIVNNGSIDRTIEIAYKLSNKYSEISFSKLELKGRGRAIRTEWMKKTTMINCYMDIDLSTDISSLPEMIELILMFSISLYTKLFMLILCSLWNIFRGSRRNGC